MGKLGRSWRLVKATFGLLKKNPKLLILPLMSGIMIVAIGAIFVAGSAGAFFLVASASPDKAVFKDGAPADPLIYVAGTAIAFLLYFICSFIAIFFNSALVGATLLSLEGKPCDWKDGVRLAWARRGAIAGWALLYAFIGTILNMIEERANKLPLVGSIIVKILTRIVGVSWSLVTFLIVPVIVFEEQPSLKERLKRSVELFKRTWGEQIVGRIGVGAALGLVALAVIFVIIGGTVGVAFLAGAKAAAGIVCFIVAAGLSVLLLIVLTLISSALNGIYSAVLYSYSVTGMLPEEFPKDLLPQPAKKD